MKKANSKKANLRLNDDYTVFGNKTFKLYRELDKGVKSEVK